MIALVDYGVGNLRSAAKALEAVGADVVVTRDSARLASADRIVLPGVGAFGECMKNLEATGLIDDLTEQVLQRRKPFLGICVGMQLLADEGYENGVHRGLGWVPGVVRPFHPTQDLKVPHVGWNDVYAQDDAVLFKALGVESVFYFVHSYCFEPADSSVTAATSIYGRSFVSAIQVDNIVATQFHPEKSQFAGLALLQNFVEWDP